MESGNIEGGQEMTEERIIITISRESNGYYDYDLDRGEIILDGSFKCEPATPKDWKGPMCIAPDENGKCTHPYFVDVFDDSPMEEQCIKCPFRKLEE